MSCLARISIVALSVVVFLYVGLGYVLGKTSDDKSYRSLSVFGEVLQHIQEDYVDEPNMAVVTSGAMHGLLESLDPLSGYLSPREYADYRDRTKNAVHGEVGMTVSKRYGYIVIVSVVPDGPVCHTRYVRRAGQRSLARRSRNSRKSGSNPSRKDGTPGIQHQSCADRPGTYCGGSCWR